MHIQCAIEEVEAKCVKILFNYIPAALEKYPLNPCGPDALLAGICLITKGVFGEVVKV
jgi:hypothetical protein